MRFVVLVSILLWGSSVAYAGDTRLSFGFGRSEIDLDSIVFDVAGFGSAETGDPTLATMAFFGYAFDSNLVIDLGYTSITTDTFIGELIPFSDLTDALHYDSFDLLIGYLYKNGGLYVEPKVGFAKWDIELDEATFLANGPLGKWKQSGFDPQFMLTVGVRFVELFGMSVSYRYVDFSEGDVATVSLGFDLSI